MPPTLFETRLLYSSEKWPPLPVRHAKRREGVQMSWTRKAVKRHRGEGCRGRWPNSCRVLDSHGGKQGKAPQTELFVAAALPLSLASRTASGSGHATALNQGDCWRPGGPAGDVDTWIRLAVENKASWKQLVKPFLTHVGVTSSSNRENGAMSRLPQRFPHQRTGCA